jgi:hypothetical protein
MCWLLTASLLQSSWPALSTTIPDAVEKKPYLNVLL